MPNKSIPTIGESNWGVTLNRHLSQLINPTTGSINSFSQFSQRSTTLTLDDIDLTYLYTQTGNLHRWSGDRWNILNQSFVNVKDYGAIGDGVTDDTAALQNILYNIEPGRMYFPAGTYVISDTLNLPTINNLKHHIHI